MTQIIATEPNCEATSMLYDGLARALWGLCWQQNSAAELVQSSAAMPDWLGQTLLRLQEAPGTAIAELAHETGWSPAQFRRHFHHWVGMSPRDYVQQLRLQQARQWLETTEWPVMVIAEKLGFQNASQFGRVFKAGTNFTPQAYRKFSRQRETAI